METPLLINRPTLRLWQSLRWAGLALLLMSCSAGAAQKGAAATTHKPPKNTPAEDVALVKARERVLGANPLEMFYYSSDTLGLASLQAHAGAMGLLGPQCFRFDRAGVVHGEIPAEVMEAARGADLPLMPLVVNTDFNRAGAHALLRNRKAQERAAMYLAYLAQRDQYVGWQLDVENIAPADKAAYSRFVERVAARLHQERRLLSVAVVARFSDTFPGNSEFRTGEWGAAYDFRALARAADFLSLMAYDQHSPLTPPGPVAGYDWVQAALEYAVSRVPPTKLLLAIPFYGREWMETYDRTKSQSLGYEEFKQLFDGSSGGPYWDELARTTWYQVWDGETDRIAWFDDARSLREKLRLVETYHLRGFAAWRLGMEDPHFWPMAAQFARSTPQERLAGAEEKGEPLPEPDGAEHKPATSSDDPRQEPEAPKP